MRVPAAAVLLLVVVSLCALLATAAAVPSSTRKEVGAGVSDRRVVKHLNCKIGRERIYEYNSVVNAFSGVSDGVLSDDDNNGNNNMENVHIRSLVAIGCARKYLKPNGKYVYLLEMQMRNVTAHFDIDKLSDENGWSEDNDKSSEKPDDNKDPSLIEIDVKNRMIDQNKKNLDHYFDKYTGWTMSSNGKIYKTYMDREELAFVSAIKKQIISQLQIKLSADPKTENDARVEKDGAGTHRARYEKTILDDGSVLVTKSFTDLDAVAPTTEADDEPLDDLHGGAQSTAEAEVAMRKEAKIEVQNHVLVDKEGEIVGSVLKSATDIGTHSRRTHPAFFDNSNLVPFDSKATIGKESDFLRGHETSSLKYVTTIDKVEESALSDEVEFLADGAHPKIAIKDKKNVREGDLGMDEEALLKHTRASRLRFLSKQYDFQVLVERLIQDPENGPLRATVADFLWLKPELVEYVALRFKHVIQSPSTSSSSAHLFAQVAQGLFAACNCTRGTELLVESMGSDDEALAHHGVMRAMDVQSPTDDIVHKLIQLSKKHRNPVVRENAYLAAAAVVSRLDRKSAAAKQVIDTIVNNIHVALSSKSNATTALNDDGSDDFESEFELLKHINAIGNAGDRIPLKFLAGVILNANSGSADVRAHALHALRKRLNPREDAQVTKLIHAVLAKRDADLGTKIAAVRVQIEREKVLRNGRSLQFFADFLIDPETPEELRAYIVAYFYENGSNEAGDILQDAASFHSVMYADLEADDQVMATSKLRLRRVVRRVGRAVRRVVRRVGRAVGRVVKVITEASQVGKKVKKAFDDIKNAFKSATFTDHQVCFTASSKGDKLCVYDRGMASFIEKQGDLSKSTTNRHFAFEKLIGANKLHMYAGLVGYAGTNFSCKRKPSEFTFAVFGRAHMHAHVFGKSLHFLTGEFTARQTSGNVASHMFLKLLENVIVNKPLYRADRINLCSDSSGQLANKQFPNMPGFNIVVMIGPFPLGLGFSMSLGAQVDSLAKYCNKDLTASAGIVPSVAFGVKAHAAFDIIVARAGVEIEATLNYGFYPNLNVNGLQCKICASLNQAVKPMNFKVNVFAEVDLWFLKKGVRKTVYSWGAPAQTSTIVEKCLALPAATSTKTTKTSLPATKSAKVLSDNVPMDHIAWMDM